MATYKLIQDIEAEDHILGPLTLRQFIFALIAVFLFYICFLSIVKHFFFLLVIFLPPALFFGFFALPFGRDQPTEIWFLAKLRFWFKPRRRVWNQTGLKELVTITAPKKVERILTKGLSQTEVKSRLQALAQTLDTRGWAVKHAAGDSIELLPVVTGDSDRLIGINSLPQEVPAGDPEPNGDVWDATTSPIARQFDDMIERSSQDHREQLIKRLQTEADTAAKADSAKPAAVLPSPVEPNNWFIGQPHQEPPGPPPEPVASGGVESAPDDSALSLSLAARAKSRQISFGNLRTIKPVGSSRAAPTPVVNDQVQAMTTPSDPAILSLASNDDLNVATLARQAKKSHGGMSSKPNEVVISLH